MRPPALWLMFDNHAADGLVWCVRSANTWTRYAHVEVSVPMRTNYRGPKSRQPRAFLAGRGWLVADGDTAYLRETPQRVSQ